MVLAILNINKIFFVGGRYISDPVKFAIAFFVLKKQKIISFYPFKHVACPFAT